MIRSIDLKLWRLLLLCCASLGFAACSKQKPQSETAGDAPFRELNACELLTAEEIASIQGASPQKTTPSGRAQVGVSVAQCYFALPTAADSLNLVVQRKAPGAAKQTPATIWQEMFHTEKDAEKVGRDGKEKEERKPDKIEGVGDEAYWVGGQFGGMLHVLKGETVVQISVGGPGGEAQKVEKLKQLARIVLQRVD